MGIKQWSRRRFLKQMAGPDADTNDTGNDPLFEKFSRKKSGSRHYSQEEVVYRPEDAAKDDARIGNVTSGLSPYTGAWTEAEALHLLRRTNFGAKKSQVDTLLQLTPSAAVDAVLNVSAVPPAPPVNWYQNIFADEGGVAYGADWTTNAFATTSVGQTSNSYRIQGLRNWLFGLTVSNDITIREKMTWFWYHFMPVDFKFIFESSNTYTNTNCARILYRYMKLFRDSATGNFKTLIRSVATEPAMMFYLNNQANTATAPDENFARELMELFTLGKDPLSQYTQNDVIAAAKVLTGWRVQNLNTLNVATNFLPNLHSTANKQFSSFFNNTVIAYQSSTNGALELDALINMIFAKDVVVSQYICRRLYRYFVYYDIDANIEANVIVPLAQTFVSNNWNILPVLQQLFKSQHFFDMANRGVVIKSPFDQVAGMLNTFNMNLTGATTEAQYRIWSRFNETYSKGMEQDAGSIPNVAGWNAYSQSPAFHQYWINSNTVQKRFIFIRDQFNGYSISGVTGMTFKIDVLAFAQQFGTTIPADPDQLTATCIKYLLPIDLSQPQKDALKQSTLLSGQTTNSYWTTAWNNYIAAPTNTTTKGVVETRLKNLLVSICQLAEYQLH